MESGIHVQIQAADIESCPVTSVAEDVPIESVITDLTPTDDGVGVIGEMTARTPDGSSSTPDSATEVFSDGSRSVYRFDNADGSCPCSRIPQHGCPIRSLRSVSGALELGFVVSDLRTLKGILSDLQSRCGSVEVRQLVRSTPDGEGELLFVDRSAFTDRQYEVLRTAHEMGYFARPRGSTSTDVAAELDISTSTFGEHLSAAQSKLLDQIFQRG